MSKFITFEGGEGCGKSTQVELLAEHLRRIGHRVITTREPGGTEGAEEIRELLIHGDKEKWDGKQEVLLNFAARMDHVNNLIKPALERGEWVICDRFFDSTYVYQGIAQGVGSEYIDIIREASMGGFAPDKTFILDMEVKESLDRVNSRGEQNRYDEMDVEFHQKIRAGFLKIAQDNPERCVVINALQDIKKVHEEIVEKL
ncbi:MAG: dTMP kinase [Alphaproteobacteria bacterium CG11_big_fil_rev_8_21_14_0_20_44_7]|nr:MAG: dTMP kinase [Alphaproteobacteria bacterium CG11_big_fil_rev_8_21_14_0_20_44_7]